MGMLCVRHFGFIGKIVRAVFVGFTFLVGQDR